MSTNHPQIKYSTAAKTKSRRSTCLQRIFPGREAIPDGSPSAPGNRRPA